MVVAVTAGEGTLRRTLEVVHTPVHDATGAVTGVVVGPVAAAEHERVRGDLEARETRFCDLFHRSPYGAALYEMVFDGRGEPVDFVYMDANAAFETCTGLPAADIIGRRVTEVVPGIEHTPFIGICGEVARSGEARPFEQYAAPLGRHYSVSAFPLGGDRFATRFAAERSVAAGGPPVHLDRCAPQLDTWVSVTHYSTSPGECATVVDDITERRAAEREILRLNRLYVTLRAVDPRMGPWRTKALTHGFRSSAAVPVKERDRAAGALMVYATEAAAFTSDDEALLEGVARHRRVQRHGAGGRRRPRAPAARARRRRAHGPPHRRAPEPLSQVTPGDARRRRRPGPTFFLTLPGHDGAV